jgi:hypothetical protein
MEIVQLEQVNGKFARAIDFLLENIVVGFITEFTLSIMKSYSAVEQEFLKGPRGRYINSLYTSINILPYNNGVMTMESDN